MFAFCRLILLSNLAINLIQFSFISFNDLSYLINWQRLWSLSLPFAGNSLPSYSWSLHQFETLFPASNKVEQIHPQNALQITNSCFSNWQTKLYNVPIWHFTHEHVCPPTWLYQIIVPRLKWPNRSTTTQSNKSVLKTRFTVKFMISGLQKMKSSKLIDCDEILASFSFWLDCSNIGKVHRPRIGKYGSKISFGIIRLCINMLGNQVRSLFCLFCP